jgi:hypothetical protein
VGADSAGLATRTPRSITVLVYYIRTQGSNTFERYIIQYMYPHVEMQVIIFIDLRHVLFNTHIGMECARRSYEDPVLPQNQPYTYTSDTILSDNAPATT